ncbi:MAG: Sec-independent protein translocase protein TatB [Actinobacteria bacterium]|nr:Sec-independent protein translocase protein TatB [Actinomycetota bacterium]
MNLGWPEILIILVVALLIFGPKRLPEIGSSIGKTLRKLRSSQEEAQEKIREELEIDEIEKDIRDSVG